MEFSLPAWLGGLAGAVIAVAIYVPAIRFVERTMRAQGVPSNPEGREAFEEKLSLIRRAILGVDIAILATLGYWIGKILDGAGAAHIPF